VAEEFTAFDFFQDALVSITIEEFNLRFLQLVGKGFETNVLSILMG